MDTLWRERSTGDESNHSLGRTCKVYALVAGGWKMTVQTGADRLSDDEPELARQGYDFARARKIIAPASQPERLPKRGTLAPFSPRANSFLAE